MIATRTGLPKIRLPPLPATVEAVAWIRTARPARGLARRSRRAHDNAREYITGQAAGAAGDPRPGAEARNTASGGGRRPIAGRAQLAQNVHHALQDGQRCQHRQQVDGDRKQTHRSHMPPGEQKTQAEHYYALRPRHQPHLALDAESLGVECKVGLMSRPERIVVLGLGLLLSGWHVGSVSLLTVAVYLLAVLTSLTVLQRMVHVLRKLRAAGDGPAPAA